MAKCVIFCAGEFDALAQPIEPGDLVIAADGGVRHVQALGILPDMVLGDFDSLGYVPQGAQVFPVEKDDTDTMLAVRRGLELGARDFVLYGGVDGPRLDHTVANFQTLQFLCDRGARGFLVGRDMIITVVKDGGIRFPAGLQGTVSVFCQGGPARGVCLRGLQYPLEEGLLTPGFPLGLGNHFTGAEAEISLREGSLLVLWERSCGFPL